MFEPNEFLTTTETEMGRTVVIAVTGEVDMATREAMADPIFTRLAASPPALVIDLTRIQFLGLAGISILLETQSRALESATTLRIVATTPVVLRPLATVGLLSTLPICRTMTEALDSIAREAVQAGRGSLVQAQ